MAWLQAENLYKTYTTESKPVEVLRDVSLEIKPQDSLAILGASGSGKSTLLHILGTLDPPSKGRVLVGGEDVYQIPDSKLSRFRNQKVGFVFQFHHLLPMLTAEENVMLPAMIGGETQKNAVEAARVLLDQVGLQHRGSHRPTELSGGEQQRVAIARALVMAPAILLADEPTGNLDSENGAQISELLLELQEKHKNALVVVTHTQTLAKRLKQQLHLRDGKVETTS